MKCSICGREIPSGSGSMFVWNDGRIAYYCGSKCKNNAALGREPKKLNWIKKKK
ncbi:MAG: 50S ribosomal protein L24e [Candidatus Aenigmatarchaeota archaeon]|nr:50S ribosomal protein L24e [Candidatus Aenigmarchaeota archaeon]